MSQNTDPYYCYKHKGHFDTCSQCLPSPAAVPDGARDESVLKEYVGETVELVHNSAEEARREGVPSCNFYDMEELISKMDIPQSEFRYVSAWKAYETIKSRAKAARGQQ